jgi:hypothetical protein
MSTTTSSADGKLDASRPEALMYEPKGGKLELVGVEYIVIVAAWDAANKTPPTLMGQLFHYNTSPNRYGIPAYYSCTSGRGGTTPPASSATGIRMVSAMAIRPWRRRRQRRMRGSDRRQGRIHGVRAVRHGRMRIPKGRGRPYQDKSFKKSRARQTCPSSRLPGLSW